MLANEKDATPIGLDEATLRAACTAVSEGDSQVEVELIVPAAAGSDKGTEEGTALAVVAQHLVGVGAAHVEITVGAEGDTDGAVETAVIWRVQRRSEFDEHILRAAAVEEVERAQQDHLAA